MDTLEPNLLNDETKQGGDVKKLHKKLSGALLELGQSFDPVENKVQRGDTNNASNQPDDNLIASDQNSDSGGHKLKKFDTDKSIKWRDRIRRRKDYAEFDTHQVEDVKDETKTMANKFGFLSEDEVRSLRYDLWLPHGDGALRPWEIEMSYQTAWDTGRIGCVGFKSKVKWNLKIGSRKIRFFVMDGTNPDVLKGMKSEKCGVISANQLSGAFWEYSKRKITYVDDSKKTSIEFQSEAFYNAILICLWNMHFYLAYETLELANIVRDSKVPSMSKSDNDIPDYIINRSRDSKLIRFRVRDDQSLHPSNRVEKQLISKYKTKDVNEFNTKHFNNLQKSSTNTKYKADLLEDSSHEDTFAQNSNSKSNSSIKDDNNLNEKHSPLCINSLILESQAHFSSHKKLSNRALSK